MGNPLKTAFVYCHAAITCLIVKIQCEKKKRRGKKRNCHLQLQAPKPSRAQDTAELLKLLEESFLFVTGLFHLQSTSQVFSNPMRIMLCGYLTISENL